MKRLSNADFNGTTTSNERGVPRVNTLVVATSTYTPNGDTTDVAIISAPTASFTVAAPTGTPNDGQKLVIRIKQDGSGSRVATWNAIYRFPAGTAPTLTTTASKTDYLGFIYNSADTKWDCVAYTLNI